MPPDPWTPVLAVGALITAVASIAAAFWNRKRSRDTARALCAANRPSLVPAPPNRYLPMPNWVHMTPYEGYVKNAGKNDAILLRITLDDGGRQVSEPLGRRVLVRDGTWPLPDVQALQQKLVTEAVDRWRRAGRPPYDPNRTPTARLRLSIEYADVLGNEYVQEFDELNPYWLDPTQCHLTYVASEGLLAKVFRQYGEYLFCIMFALCGRRTTKDALFPLVSPTERHRKVE